MLKLNWSELRPYTLRVIRENLADNNATDPRIAEITEMLIDLDGDEPANAELAKTAD